MHSSSIDWRDMSVLITGGTGSFGSRFVETMINDFHPRRLKILSRDEEKQTEMKRRMGGVPVFLLGDVRDYDRLRRAFSGVDIVVHAAALKQVPAVESDPFEAVQTNVIGARNVIDAAIDVGVQRVTARSTDKAVSPANLYGGTKFVAEKLFVQGNGYSPGKTIFACTRYGNVIGSRGSVIPLFKEQRKTGRITITDERMTRFWISLDDGVAFVIKSIERMLGGEVFVPKLPSMRITDLATIVAPDCKIDVTGIRPGEKIHEELISLHESRLTLEYDDYYVVTPTLMTWREDFPWTDGRPVPPDFQYSSDNNPVKLTDEEMGELVKAS